jgi:muramoyltetrapeptide carboxypeptidase
MDGARGKPRGFMLRLHAPFGGSQVKVQKPAKLRKNSTVAVISPSSNPDHVGIQLGIDLLKKMGLKVVLGDTTRKLMTVRTLAADDEMRAKDMNWAFEDDSIDAVLCATGGYGSLRVLDLLDLDMIKDHPKIFLGFSDITAYHMAFNQFCGMVTFHGPVIDIDPSKGQEEIRTQTEDLTRCIRQLMGQEPVREITNPPEGMMLMTIDEGKASGRLCGGNLTLVTGTLGSRYEIDTKDKILMLEEVKETYYYIEFHLTQLRLTRKLDQARGIIIGEISDTLKPEGPHPSVEEIVRERVAGTHKPAIWGLCCGHGKRNMLLPMNAKVALDATKREITVLESVLE